MNLEAIHNISSIKAGISTSCFVTEEGELYVWGILGEDLSLHFKFPQQIQFYNSNSNPINVHVIDVSCGDLFMGMITLDGGVFTFGTNVDNCLGKEGIPFANSPLKLDFESLKGRPERIYCGRSHVIVNCGGKFYGWGSNSYHQLFEESTEPIPTPTLLTSLNNSSPSSVFSGYFHSFAFCGNGQELLNVSQKTQKHSKDEFMRLQQEIGKLKKENGFLQSQVNSLIDDNYRITEEYSKLKSGSLDKYSKAKNGFSKDNIESIKREIGIQCVLSVKATEKPELEIQNFIKKNKEKKFIAIERMANEQKQVTPQFEIDFSEIVLEKQIAEGGYGLIYRGKWRETVVAIKVLKKEGLNDAILKDFLCSLLKIIQLNAKQWRLSDIRI